MRTYFETLFKVQDSKILIKQVGYVHLLKLLFCLVVQEKVKLQGYSTK